MKSILQQEKRVRHMKKILLVLGACAALAGCANDAKNAAAIPQQGAAAKPSESLLTTDDMHACEQQLGVAQPKTAADLYVLSADTLDKIKNCAFEREKQRMPLLADLIDKYKVMLQQGDQDCNKDTGTRYASSCMKDNIENTGEWYNLAVSERVLNAMPSQPQVQVQIPPRTD